MVYPLVSRDALRGHVTLVSCDDLWCHTDLFISHSQVSCGTGVMCRVYYSARAGTPTSKKKVNIYVGYFTSAVYMVNIHCVR